MALFGVKNLLKAGFFMAYDTFVLAACLRDIERQALGAKINKIHQPGKHCLILRFYGKNGSGKILLAAGAEDARLHLTAESPENPAHAPLFLMVARKWLEGAVLQAVRQTPYERVAELTFSTRNDLGDSISVRLICEIMGKHSNIILVDEAGLIIDGIRRYDSRLSRYREVLPQRPYIPPPPFTKAPPPFTDEEALAAALLQEDYQGTVAEALPRRIAGISPWLARELLAKAGVAANLPLEETGAYELALLLQQINTLPQRLAAADFTPTLLMQEGRPADFAAFDPCLWQDKERRHHAAMSEALADFYAARTLSQAFEQQRRRLEKSLRQHMTRLQRKISLQKEDLAASERGEKFKEAGDLLATHLYQLCGENNAGGRGLMEVSLPSFADPAQLIQIELDAALTPQQNIQRYYRKYNKCRKARAPIESHLRNGEEELQYLQSIAHSLNTAMLTEELAEIERELMSSGLLPAPPPRKGKKTNAAAAISLPPRSYTSADGFTILVGRNNKQNERLSLKMAAPEDMWLHTQKIPGSHVIIVSNGREIPDTTLTEAASYAAWFSQAQDSPKVAVDYARAAQVKKPQGAKPGMVVYFQQQTVYVRPRQPEE